MLDLNSNLSSWFRAHSFFNQYYFNKKKGLLCDFVYILVFNIATLLASLGFSKSADDGKACLFEPLSWKSILVSEKCTKK